VGKDIVGFLNAGGATHVAQYIDTQEQHHGRRSYEQEFKALLDKRGVEYDPKLVFG
jgi:hypothetical protein